MAYFIIISIIYALISGNIENSSNGIFDSMNSAVNLTITFLELFVYGTD